MRCTYRDDVKVDYTGSLHITKGEGVDLTVKAGQIPSNIRTSLDSAVSHNSCDELWAASSAFTATIPKFFGKETVK
jgi:hypothetical protein